MWNQEYGMEMEEEQFDGETWGEMNDEHQEESSLDEMQEMELAAELLSVSNEGELDQFLGSIIKKAANIIKSPVGKALGGVLKGIAKKALPVVGGAIGSFVAPGVGTAIGSSLGSAAGKMFGLELEGMTNEDQEFEVARRYVRLATTAARKAAAAPPNIPPQQAAKRAIAAAARIHAPGLLSGALSSSSEQGNNNRKSGRWIRRGRNIVILGA